MKKPEYTFDKPTSRIRTPDGLVHQQLWIYNAPAWTICEDEAGERLWRADDLRASVDVPTCLRCLGYRR